MLSPSLHDVNLVSQSLGKPVDPGLHMGIRIEIDAASAGVMVASEGTEILLLP